MARNLLCAIGFHKIFMKEKWIPNISDPIITDFIQIHSCQRCGKIISNIHWRWDGEQMVDVL